MPHDPAVPTVDRRLRFAIDRGDEAPGPDPAAAALGTDAEAGARTKEERAIEADAQRAMTPECPSAGAGAAESRRGDGSHEEAALAERRSAGAARPSEGGAAAESARAGETMPTRENETGGMLSDDQSPHDRLSAAP